VDVNVHPTKAEVRFRDSNRVYSHLLSTLRQTFLKSDLHARLQPVQDESGRDLGHSSSRPSPMAPPASPGFAFPEEPGSPQPKRVIAPDAPPVGVERFNMTGTSSDRQTVASWFDSNRPENRALPTIAPPAPPAWSQSLPRAFETGPASEFDEFGDSPTPPTPGSTRSDQDPAPAPETPPDTNESVSNEPVTRPLPPELWEMPLKAIQVHDTYLIAETNDGMVVIDQHALHERILYEELRRRVAEGRVESQRLLVPEPVDLSASEAALVLEQKDALNQLGVDIEPFGGDTILVSAVPAMLRTVEPARLLRDLAEHLRTKPLPPTRDGLLAELLHMMACKGAIKANQPLTPTEITSLLDRRHLVADSHHCPHGRPTALVFTKADLEKQFGRI